MTTQKLMFSSATRVCIFLSVLTLLASIGFNASSLILPRWLCYSVNPAVSASAPSLRIAQSRTRGVFLECLTNTSSAALSTFTPLFTTCWSQELSEPDVHQRGGDVLNIVYLRRWHIGIQCAAGFVIILAFVKVVVMSFVMAPVLFLVASIYAVFGAGLHAGANGIWHSFLMIEHLGVVSPMNNTEIYGSWPAGLKAATAVSYDISYYFSWTAVGSALLAAIFLMSAFYCCIRDNFVSDEHNSKPSKNSVHHFGHGHAQNPYTVTDGDHASYSSSGRRLPRTPAYIPPPTFDQRKF